MCIPIRIRQIVEEFDDLSVLPSNQIHPTGPHRPTLELPVESVYQLIDQDLFFLVGLRPGLAIREELEKRAHSPG